MINRNLDRNLHLDMLQNQIVLVVNHVVTTTFNPDGTEAFNRNYIVFQQSPSYYGSNVRGT